MNPLNPLTSGCQWLVDQYTYQGLSGSGSSIMTEGPSVFTNLYTSGTGAGTSRKYMGSDPNSTPTATSTATNNALLARATLSVCC